MLFVFHQIAHPALNKPSFDPFVTKFQLKVCSKGEDFDKSEWIYHSYLCTNFQHLYSNLTKVNVQVVL